MLHFTAKIYVRKHFNAVFKLKNIGGRKTLTALSFHTNYVQIRYNLAASTKLMHVCVLRCKSKELKTCRNGIFILCLLLLTLAVRFQVVLYIQFGFKAAHQTFHAIKMHATVMFNLFLEWIKHANENQIYNIANILLCSINHFVLHLQAHFFSWHYGVWNVTLVSASASFNMSAWVKKYSL